MGAEKRPLRSRGRIDSVKAQAASRNEGLWTVVAGCAKVSKGHMTPHLAPAAQRNPEEGRMIKASFSLEKETKNTIRYTEKPEAGKPPAIGTIYIQKWALPEPTPASITVTIDA